MSTKPAAGHIPLYIHKIISETNSGNVANEFVSGIQNKLGSPEQIADISYSDFRSSVARSFGEYERYTDVYAATLLDGISVKMAAICGPEDAACLAQAAAFHDKAVAISPSLGVTRAVPDVNSPSAMFGFGNMNFRDFPSEVRARLAYDRTQPRLSEITPEEAKRSEFFFAMDRQMSAGGGNTALGTPTQYHTYWRMKKEGASPEQIMKALAWQDGRDALVGLAGSTVAPNYARMYQPKLQAPSSAPWTYDIRSLEAAETAAPRVFDLGVSGPQYTLKAPTIAGFEGTTGTVSTRAFVVHGNSKLSPRPATLYELYQVGADGSQTFLKYGISQNPATRYSKSFMEDKIFREVATGRRSDMLTLERQMVTQNPGPLNFEPWAVKARGGN